MTIKCVIVEAGTVPYEEALELQRARVRDLKEGVGSEYLYLLQHPPVITIGRNATTRSIIASRELLDARSVEVYETDRGGDATFHGPGQLVGYPILHLEEGRRDVARYVTDMEEILIRTLAEFSIGAARRESKRGVWIGERKIASIGVRISRWVTSHGFALNVATDLSFFSLINPCGIEGCVMTSMEKELGCAPEMDDVVEALSYHFERIFGRELLRTREEATV